MAITAVSSLYPPQVDTFMPAFINTDGVIINFSVSPYNSAGNAGGDGFYSNSIRSVHIVVLDQKTNQDALGSTNVFFPSVSEGETEYDKDNVDYAQILLNRTLIIPFNETYIDYDENTGVYSYKLSVDVLKQELDEKGNALPKKFKTDQYYKVQLRFDSCDRDSLLQDTLGTHAIDEINPGSLNYNYLTENRQYFSEWSSVCLIRAIDRPILLLSGYRSFSDFTDPDIEQDAANGILPSAKVPSYNPGSFSLFGRLHFTGGTETEHLQSYKFSIRERADLEAEPLYETETFYAAAPKYEISSLINFDNAKANSTYYLAVEWTTCNQYSQTDVFKFNINEYEHSLTFAPEINISVNEEDGYVNVKVIGQASTEGNLLIKRASSIDDFKEWTLIHYEHTGENIEVDFKDMTVGSLLCYDYSVQFQFSKGTLSEAISWYKDLKKDYIYPSFYDMLIYRQGKQIAIRYNGQISNLKPIVNRVKVDTLGSKYPRFAENAKMNYKQYNIAGLISAEADFNRQFLSEVSSEYELEMEYYDKYMDGKYITRNDTVADGEQVEGNEYKSSNRSAALKNTSHDAYPLENWYWEREFRETLVAWLNDGKPKLFRSMTEGNILVMITNVSLTPNKTIGRMLYDFSATLYEVGDGYSLSSLGDSGIIDLPVFIADYEATEDEQSNESSKKVVEAVLQTYQWTNNTGAVYDIINGSTEYNESLSDLLYFKYQGFFDNKTWRSLKVKSIKIQFTSEPRFYEVQGNLLTPVDEKDATSKHLYGHRLILGFVKKKPGDAIDFSSSDFAEIFVNEKGYYQIPTDIKIYHLFIDPKDTIIADFVVEYQEVESQDTIPASTSVLNVIVGQLSGPFAPGIFVGKEIKNKYELIQYSDKDKMLATQYMSYWDGISLDVDPYAIFKVQFYEDKETVFREFVVGRTGVFDLMFDYPIRDIGFVGRRMVLSTNPEIIEEWEFKTDPTLYSFTDQVIHPEYNTVYQIGDQSKIYYIDSKWYNFNFIERTVGCAEVPINGYLNYTGDLIRSEY